MQTTEQSDVTLTFLVSQGFSPTILERFWAKVEKSQEPDGCWIWKGAKILKSGYGRISRKGHGNSIEYAHRVSWLIHFGIIPSNMLVCHDCPHGDNPGCVHPEHLFLGSSKDNSQDMEKKCRTGLTAKITALEASEIRRLRKTIRGVVLAEMYGVSQATISLIKHQKTWRNAARIEPRSPSE